MIINNDKPMREVHSTFSELFRRINQTNVLAHFDVKAILVHRAREHSGSPSLSKMRGFIHPQTE